MDPLPLRPLPAKPKAILIVGVNGTGKTTSTAKLAHFLKKNRHTVLLAAADTFRAAAIEQLGIWAERLGVEIITGQYNADPAALCYEAYQAADRSDMRVPALRYRRPPAHQEQPDGRAEQGETQPRQARPECAARNPSRGRRHHRKQRARQAREFHQSIGLTGLIVTKLDGSGKGGVVIAIQDELGIPTRFIGTGEELDDFAPFDGRDFIEKML